MTKEDIMQFIETLDVTDENKERLRKLSPESYVGLAAKMAESVDSK